MHIVYWEISFSNMSFKSWNIQLQFHIEMGTKGWMKGSDPSPFLITNEAPTLLVKEQQLDNFQDSIKNSKRIALKNVYV